MLLKRGYCAPPTLILAFCLLCGCSSRDRGVAGSLVTIDGSSTVYPLTSTVAEEFTKANPNARIQVRFSGTTNGFDLFCKGQTDIQDASRPIEAGEVDACRAGGVGYVELPVAHDGLTVIVNHANTWALTITTAELKRLWEPAAERRVQRWSQVRAGWPDRPITLHGPGTRSGTFDFFTSVIVGRERASRTDFHASEDDEVVVKGVSGDPNALGYVGYVYFDRHRDALKALRVDDLDEEIGPGPIEPSPNSVRRAIYRPLSRPLFIYVNTKRLDRPEVRAFVDYYLRNSEPLAEQAGCIPLNSRLYGLIQRRVAKRVEGSLYQRPDALSQSLDVLLNQ